MAFTPTIINDGRRMYIGSRSLSFLTYEEGSSAYENIDYHSLFRGKDPGKMRFSSVLRSNATFPFVMPMVSLPTEPQLQLMDAGIRDNYGGKAIHEFLSVFDEWIGENTSGVVIIYVRDTKKILDNEQTKQLSFIDKLTMPFGNIYSNFPRVQDYNQEELYTGENAKWSFPLDLISFNLREKREDRISLSWHLTKQEKIKIHEALDSKQNKEAFEELTRLLK